MNNLMGWRRYQEKLRRRGRRRWQRVLIKTLWMVMLLAGVAYGIQEISIGSSPPASEAQSVRAQIVPAAASEPASPSASRADVFLDKKAIQKILRLDDLMRAPGQEIATAYLDRQVSIVTTLDPDLQMYMSGKIREAKSPLIGFVALEPSTGKVLALVDGKNIKLDESVCLSNRFPAASIFKIVTAAAAMERCNISPDTQINYCGGDHTLFKWQLRPRVEKYSRSVPLKTCFAKSVNPAFARLGCYELKKETLEQYASGFGFNHPIDFELPVQPSVAVVGDDIFDWAEIASGFNRRTMMSPLHGAMIAGAIINDGKLLAPTIVESVKDKKNDALLYRSSPMELGRAILFATSRDMQDMMVETVENGTGRRAFHGYRRDAALCRYMIGGKTGTIKNDPEQYLCDWFVGFCKDMDTGRKLAVATLVVHDSRLRTRSQEYVRLAMRHYFGESLSACWNNPVKAQHAVKKFKRIRRVRKARHVPSRSAASHQKKGAKRSKVSS